MIYFVCPVPAEPAGGVEKIYQYVAALDSAGVGATVVHDTAHKPAMWFETSAKVVLARHTMFNPSADVLIVPEIWAFSARIPSNSSFIILNQGAYLTFTGQGLPQATSPLWSTADSIYEHPGLLGIVCVSDDNEELLRFAFPEVRLERVRLGVDTTVFRPGELWREPVLGFMPRRRGPEIVELLRILERRGKMKPWSTLAIADLDQHGVSAALRRTAIYLNFPIREGFPLPPIEAMASGCCVVGYDGRGGREYMTSEISFPIPEGDTLMYAKTVEGIAEAYLDRDPGLEAIIVAGRRHVETVCSLERQAQDIVCVAGELIAAGRTTAAGATWPITEAFPYKNPPSRWRRSASLARQAARTALARPRP